MYSGGDTQNSRNPSEGNWVVRYISCSGLGYPSGRRITPLTIEKMAVFAPMPRASVRRAVTVNPGERRSSRAAYFTSGTIALVQPSHFMDDLLESYWPFDGMPQTRVRSRPVGTGLPLVLLNRQHGRGEMR